MDNLTHTLFAVTLGRTPLGRAGRGTTTALVIASNAPDVDIVTAARGGGGAYLQWHRGPTHGPLGIIGLAVLTAAIVWAIQRYIDRRASTPDDVPGASFGMLVVVSAVAVAAHLLMDVPTSYGTRLLSPFDWHWFAADLMPIVDVYLVAALFAGLLFGQASEASRRRNAAIVLALMAANYGVRAVAHHEAIELAPRVYGPLMPPPCDPAHAGGGLAVRWPRDEAPADPPAFAGGASRCLVDLAAIPTFLSPFKWRLIAHLSNAYELHDVDVLDARLRRPVEAGGAPWRVTVRYPDQWTPAVKAAAAAPLAQVFLGFSRYPAARWVVDQRTGVVTIRWTDMRFATGMTMDQRVGRGNLFVATVRVSPDGHVIDQQLGQ